MSLTVPGGSRPKKGNLMEPLSVLEKKVALLVETIQKLKTENGHLAEENMRLTSRLALAEDAVQRDAQRFQEIDQEKLLTTMVVDDLIKSIEEVVDGKGSV